MNYRYGSLAGLIIFILDVIAIIRVLKSSRSAGSKLLWMLLILFFPVGGVIIYFVFGSKK